MEFTYVQKGNYAGRYTDRTTGAVVGCYTRRQIKALFPDGGVRVAGELGGSAKEPAGTLQAGEDRLPVFAAGSHSVFTQKIGGYVAVDGGGYLGVVRSVAVKRLAVLLVVLAVISGSVFAAVSWNSWFAEPAGGFAIDPNASAWNGSSLPNQGESSGIAVPGYPSISIEANTRQVQMTLLNPEGNPCYFTFELVLKETGESLYTSKAVPPGQAVHEVELNRGLPPGEYPAVLRVTTNSLADQSRMNGANVETKLVVQT